MKADGAVNNTWNNRPSMIRQVFLRAVDDRKLNTDPTDNLHLPKEQAHVTQTLIWTQMPPASCLLRGKRPRPHPAGRTG